MKFDSVPVQKIDTKLVITNCSLEDFDLKKFIKEMKKEEVDLSFNIIALIAKYDKKITPILISTEPNKNNEDKNSVNLVINVSDMAMLEKIAKALKEM